MRNYIKTGFIVGLFSLALVACEDDIDPVIEELSLGRVLSPTELDAKIRNLTTIELNWKVRDDADHYVVEFSEDSLEFNTIIRTVTVQPDELPHQELFEGETRYSARVTAVSANGVPDSSPAVVTIKTATENIFLPIEDGDIEAVSVTLRWPAGSNVTSFKINPGNVDRPITDPEKEAGVATITGLTGETDYTVLLYNGTKQRGMSTFTTLIDIGTATAVYPEDDLSVVVAAAADGDVLVLFPGEYLAYTGAIDITKSISIKGLYPYDKPKLHVQFTLQNGASAMEFRDLDMDGDATLNNVFEFTNPSGDYGTLLISGCNIHDYAQRFVYGNVASKVQSLTIDNCVLTDVDITNGGDFIDFRNTHITSVTVTNSTFDNCAPGRDFIRIDAAAGYTGTGLTSTVLVDHCTLYGVSNTTDRTLYVRFNANVMTVQNTLIAETNGYYTNQSSSSQPICSNNNYFNADGYFTALYVTGAKEDISGNHTTLDPGFTDAANGNFTISNQTLKDNAVGDPRWRQ